MLYCGSEPLHRSVVTQLFVREIRARTAFERWHDRLSADVRRITKNSTTFRQRKWCLTPNHRIVCATRMGSGPSHHHSVMRMSRSCLSPSLLTVFADLVVAVNIGVVLAMLHFMRRMAVSVETQQLTEQDLQSELAHEGLGKLPEGVMVYAIEGPFFFGAVEKFE